MEGKEPEEGGEGCFEGVLEGFGASHDPLRSQQVSFEERSRERESLRPRTRGTRDVELERRKEERRELTSLETSLSSLLALRQPCSSMIED